MELETYERLCDGFARLLSPLVEAVIHDLSTGKVSYLSGELSNRKAGDPSFLDTDNLENDLCQVTYPKLNFDGRLVKSISIRLDDRFLLCLNCDVSIFNQMQSLSQTILSVTQQEGPSSLFKNDWQERVHQALHQAIVKRGWSFGSLTGKQKKDVIKYLFQQGAFSEKGAADYIAQVLGMGRATVFNYLREWRDNANPII